MSAVAPPDVASELVRAYQLDQRRVSRGLLAELLRLWRAVVRLDDLASFIQFAELAAALVGRRRDESAAIAARFYELFRQSQVPAAAVAVSPFVPVAAAPLAEDAVAGELRGAVLAGFVGGRRAGFAPGKAADNALVKAAGTATRLALDGGRETLLQAVGADDRALGWLRLTSADPCHFCLTLASRGPEYKTRETAGFQAHDHCSCVPMPVFEGTPMPASTRRAEEIYVAAQRWARENPDLAAKGTKNDALNNVRRYLEHRRSADARDTAA